MSAKAVRLRKLRALKKGVARCTWCPSRAAKGSTLCALCRIKHRLRRRERWEKERSSSARRNKCKICGELGHNARRHQLPKA